MKKLLLLTFLWILPASYSFAQYSDYKLNSYKTADYNRKSFNFRLASTGRISGETGGGDYNPHNYFLSGELSGAFVQNISTEHLQQSIMFTTSALYSYSKNHDEWHLQNNTFFYEQKNRNIKFGPSFHMANLFYKDNNAFFEVSPSIELAYSYNKTKRPTAWEIDYKLFTSSIKSNFGTGTGRIEYVEDVIHALSILETLNKKEIPSQSLSGDEINEMAKIISHIKNKRQFNHRAKFTEEIALVDSFLTANNYTKADSSNFILLQNEWKYGGLFVRHAGSRFRIGVTPAFQIVKQIDFDSQHTIQAGLYLDYQYEKPVKLKRQKSFQLSLSSDWGKPKDLNHYYTTTLFGQYGTGYYLNPRTLIQWNINQTFNWYNTKHEYDYISQLTTKQKSTNYLTSMTRVAINAFYYLSPQLLLSGGFDFEYYYTKNISDDIKRYDRYPKPAFNLALVYRIY